MQQAVFERVKGGFSPEAVNQYIAALAQENERLKASLNTYETKLKEMTALASYLKQQNNSERLRLADVMVQANQKATEITVAAEKESGFIKAAAVEEATLLKKKLDAELAMVREVFGEITDATEAVRRDLLNMFQKVDISSRNAAALLRAWKQSTPDTEVKAASEYVSKAPAGEKELWLETMSELLKSIPPPEKAGQRHQSSYDGNNSWNDE